MTDPERDGPDETSEVPEGIDAEGVTGWFEAHAPGVEAAAAVLAHRRSRPTSRTA